MTEPTPTRRSLLHGGLALGVSSAALLSIKGLADAAVGAVPTTSSRAALTATTGCTTLTPTTTQGPFWVDEKLNRSDIRFDTGPSGDGQAVAGVPLTLTIQLQDAGANCTPQVGAYVDIWHADAQGVYSDVSGSGNPNEVGHNFLRGYQVSDANGQVTFTTIWPGWYTSRTVHIHCRVRLSLDSSTTVNFTTQIFFPDTVNNTVLATSTYTKSRSRDTTNATDSIYESSMEIPVTGSVSSGYAGTFTVNLDFGDGAPTATASPSATVTATATATATPSSSPTSSPTSTPTTPTDTLVDATYAGLELKHRGKRRTVLLSIDAEEKVTGRLRLLDHDDLLASRTTGWLAAGRRTIKLKVPTSVPAGRYDVVLLLADAAGNTKQITKRLRLPAA
ncbi:hypothetical protein GCM10022215_19290 [Nocardioides fonticola]|uniref:Intradiol ring-cleavage dioxygenases domain-containing protein n=1 Tax=Nocardioides fonticola TaxID=450363 RepID=A0ABP7XHZ0_9ACTN